jgi:type VI secretion system protein ImpM
MSAAPQPSGGLYGKVPAFGDFVLRGLPTAFVKPWDEWLSSSISASRGQIADRWTEAYLTSPPWRFALDPGLAGAVGWIGALASSVDEVRRCYPITVAIPLPSGARLSDLSGDLDQIATSLEGTALQLIAGELTPEAASAALEELARLLPQSAFLRPALSRGGRERLQSGIAYASLTIMAAHLTQRSDGPEDAMSAWWHGHWHTMPAANFVTAGLPSPDVFASFLDGAWRERGWTIPSS